MSSKRNWFLHLKSFYSLILVGFIFVAAPLVAAVMTGAYYVDKLTEQSQEAVYRSVKTTQLSRILLQQTTAMERNVRQYLVLGNVSLLDTYFERHEYYQETVSRLSSLTLDPELKEQLLGLTNLEASLHQRLTNSLKGGEEELTIQPQDYITLTEAAKAILVGSNKTIDNELDIMNELSAEAQDTIFWELMALLPTTAVFIGVFTVLLAKPVRQVDTAIRKIGEGKFDAEVKVSGPRDIEYLGERLDWLRLRLKYLEDKKIKFLRFVSHELKTPLTAIRESADLLSDGVTGPLSQSQREVTDILRANSINLQKMIEKILTFNMPDDANLTSSFKKIRIKKIIENILADHTAPLMSKNIKINLRCEDWEYMADEEQFRVMIDNVLSNAIKFSPDNGAIFIHLQKIENELVLDIRDEGPGVEREDQARIFDAFYQGRPPEKGLIQGSGLGLSIVKEFVEVHNGEITLLTESSGKGAHLRMTFPMANAEKELAWAV